MSSVTPLLFLRQNLVPFIIGWVLLPPPLVLARRLQSHLARTSSNSNQAVAAKHPVTVHGSQGQSLAWFARVVEPCQDDYGVEMSLAFFDIVPRRLDSYPLALA